MRWLFVKPQSCWPPVRIQRLWRCLRGGEEDGGKQTPGLCTLPAFEFGRINALSLARKDAQWQKPKFTCFSQGLNHNSGVLQSFLTTETIVMIMVSPWPSHLLIENVKIPVPFNPTEIKHSWNKTDGDTAYFWVKQLAQKNRSSLALSSDVPGQQPAPARWLVAMWVRKPALRPAGICAAAVRRAGVPSAPHRFAGQRLAQKSFSSD